MIRRRLGRRDFLKLSAVGALGSVVAACGPAATPAPTTAPTSVPAPTDTPAPVPTTAGEMKYSEAPMLAERVKAGSLPPVEERLPEKPLVIGGRDAIGVYGGEMRMIHFDPIWMTSNYEINAERLLAYSDDDLKTIVPNIYESWEVADDGKTYTFHLRQGMKWSTGDPFTTEDIRFWWEDVSLDKDIGGGVPTAYRFGGKDATIEIVDEYTYTVTFAEPFGNFPAHMTRRHVGWDTVLPSAYLKQFHAKYTDQAKLDEMAKSESMDSWVNLFWDRNQWGNAIWQGAKNAKDWPSLSPWIIVDNPQEGLYLWERNPYYFKVDAQGNQLPYIDSKRYDYVQNTESVKLKLAQAEIDFVGQHDVTIADYPFYKENETKGNYIVGDYLSCMTDRFVLFPQHVLAEDKVLEEIVNQPNFVKALSVAIDREEINQSLYFGQARMGQMSPMPISKYYREEYGTAFAQYDVDLANQLLDEMGLDKRDGDDFRLRSDGKRLSFNIEHAGVRVGPSAAQFSEMVVSFWRAVGIDATTKEIQESLYNDRMTNAQVHCGMWHADRCTDMLLHIEPQWYIPTGDPGQGTASSKWAQWFQAADKNAEGLVKPPEWLLTLYDDFAKMTATTDEDERVEYGQKIFDYLAENPLAVGSVLESPAPIIFNKNLRNLPRPKVPIGWDSWGVNTYHPEAFFYEGGVRA